MHLVISIRQPLAARNAAHPHTSPFCKKGGYTAFCLRRLSRIALALTIALTLAGCEPSTPKPMVVGITGYNFTSEGVQAYYVDGHRGSNLPPYGGGGSISCCIALPRQWSSEQTVQLDWTIGHYTEPWEKRKHMSVEEESACCWTQRSLSKSVPVQPYGSEGGGVQVFFLPDDEVRVYVTDYDLGHEKHPSGMAYPKKPAGFE